MCVCDQNCLANKFILATITYIEHRQPETKQKKKKKIATMMKCVVGFLCVVCRKHYRRLVHIFVSHYIILCEMLLLSFSLISDLPFLPDHRNHQIISIFIRISLDSMDNIFFRKLNKQWFSWLIAVWLDCRSPITNRHCIRYCNAYNTKYHLNMRLLIFLFDHKFSV